MSAPSGLKRDRSGADSRAFSDEAVNTAPYFDALKGKEVPLLKVFLWVGNNIGRPLADIGLNEAPCWLALKMLEWVNEGNEAVFFKEFLTKMIPSKSQIEAQDKISDDGRATLILDKFEEEFRLANSPERPAA